MAAQSFGDVARVKSFGASLAPIETVMAESDFLVCCCLLTDETRHLVNAERLSLMKPTAFVVNVARGPIVDERALIAALKGGRIAGAGLDVYEQEPIAGDNPLKTMRNVVLAPHSLGWTDECFHDMAETGLQSLVDFSLGRRPVHVVDLGK